jgi:hypothetical protein
MAEGWPVCVLRMRGQIGADGHPCRTPRLHATSEATAAFSGRRDDAPYAGNAMDEALAAQCMTFRWRHDEFWLPRRCILAEGHDGEHDFGCAETDS